MRSVFPALHDRLLATLLFGAVLLFIATMLAVSLSEPAVESEGSEAPPLFVSGATPAQ